MHPPATMNCIKKKIFRDTSGMNVASITRKKIYSAKANIIVAFKHAIHYRDKNIPNNLCLLNLFNNDFVKSAMLDIKYIIIRIKFVLNTVGKNNNLM